MAAAHSIAEGAEFTKARTADCVAATRAANGSNGQLMRSSHMKMLGKTKAGAKAALLMSLVMAKANYRAGGLTRRERASG